MDAKSVQVFRESRYLGLCGMGNCPDSFHKLWPEDVTDLETTIAGMVRKAMVMKRPGNVYLEVGVKDAANLEITIVGMVRKASVSDANA